MSPTKFLIIIIKSPEATAAFSSPFPPFGKFLLLTSFMVDSYSVVTAVDNLLSAYISMQLCGLYLATDI